MTSACIGHVEMADAGTYTVTLENPFGKSTCSIKVKVFGKTFSHCFNLYRRLSLHTMHITYIVNALFTNHVHY